MSTRAAVVGFPWGILEGVWLKVCMCQDIKRALAVQGFRYRSGTAELSETNPGHFPNKNGYQRLDWWLPDYTSRWNQSDSSKFDIDKKWQYYT